MRVGDRYRSVLSDSEFTVTKVERERVTVDVSRRVISRDGEVSMEGRVRVVPTELWGLFSKQYKQV